MNAARSFESQAQPKAKPVVRRVVKKVNKEPKKQFYTLQNLMVLGGFLTFGLLFGQLWLDSQITALHVEAQNYQSRINSENEAASQLRSEIRELSSYSRVLEIATAHGLEVQENNIIFSD